MVDKSAGVIQFDEIGSPAAISKLIAVLSDQSKNVYLQNKLAAVVDAGKSFFKATYNLDNFKLLKNTKHQYTQATIQTSMPFSTRHSETQLKAYAKKCIQPGIDYFRRQISTNLQQAVAFFKAAQLF